MVEEPFGFPLAMASLSEQPVLGFVKTHHRQYVDHVYHLAVLHRLESGSRSPVSLIGKGVASRYSWYVRLAPRLAIEYSLGLVVPLEVSTAIDREETIPLANLSTSFPGHFTLGSRWDHRSPQNFYTMSGLEDDLHYGFGNPASVRMAIEMRAVSGMAS